MGFNAAVDGAVIAILSSHNMMIKGRTLGVCKITK